MEEKKQIQKEGNKRFWQVDKIKGTFGSPARVIVTTLLIFLLSQIAALVIVDSVLSIIRPGTNISNILTSSISVQFIYSVLATSIALGLTLWVLRRRQLTLASIGLGRRLQKQDFTKAILGFLAFYALVVAVNALIGLFVPGIETDQVQDVGFKQLISSTDWLLALVALVILPPIGEEILIRGYLYSGLRSMMRFAPALVVTSLLFGAAHFSESATGSFLWLVAVDTFILSVVLVYLREKTGALYAAIMVHAANNFVAFLVHF